MRVKLKEAVLKFTFMIRKCIMLLTNEYPFIRYQILSQMVIIAFFYLLFRFFLFLQ
jgi:hypothetical protein